MPCSLDRDDYPQPGGAATPRAGGHWHEPSAWRDSVVDRSRLRLATRPEAPRRRGGDGPGPE
jgi:hypothetical protein